MKKYIYTKVERELDADLVIVIVHHYNLEPTISRVMHLLLLYTQDHMRLLGGINRGILVHSKYSVSTQLWES